MVNSDRLTIDVHGAEGWEVCDTQGLEQDGGGAVLAIRPEEDHTVTAEFCSN